MNDWQRKLHARLASREGLGLKRHLPPVTPQGISFSSNDYLGLASTSSFAAIIKGSSGSRLLSGNGAAHLTTEALLARDLGFESALLFNSGYDANVGLIQSMGKIFDGLVYDELIHASMHEGIKLSGLPAKAFRHNHPEDLSKQLNHMQGKCLVLTESVFSMDGDEAPLEALVSICQNYDAALWVDEAHAVGVMGEHGFGKVHALGLQAQVLGVVYTFGKAVGSAGAIVAGSALLKEYLINYAKNFIYTTAMPEALASFTAFQWDRMKQAQTERAILRGHIGLVAEFLQNHFAAQYIQSASAIQCLVIPGAAACKKAATRLQAEGLYVKAILSPTVARNQERLRLCIRADHSKTDIEKLLDALKRLV